MVKVIVPTDLSLKSLELLDYTILNFPKEKMEIVLVCGLQHPDTKWGLLHFNLLKEKNKIVSEEFLKAKNQYLRTHKDRISNIHIEFFTGKNAFAFQNFMNRESTEKALVPGDGFLSFQHKKTFNPIPMIRKCASNLIEVPVGVNQKIEQTRFSFSRMLRLANQ